jgi:hypothetical protein
VCCFRRQYSFVSPLSGEHSLGEERGAVLEAIVSRTRLISRNVQAEHQQSSSKGKSPELTRIIGLSTALANPYDLADWIGIDTKSSGALSKRGLYNFRPAVRPVPLSGHIQGYPGRHYCPRMATMNKPCYAAIKDLSPIKPAMTSDPLDRTRSHKLCCWRGKPQIISSLRRRFHLSHRTIIE